MMNQDTYYQTLSRKHMAAGAILLNQHADILIVKPTYRDGWLIPGGSIDVYELLSDVCLREISEALNLTLTLQSLLYIEYQRYSKRSA